MPTNMSMHGARVGARLALAACALAACELMAGARALAAQAPDARASLVTVTVSPESVTVGQPFTVRVRVRAAKVATVQFPDVPPSADAVDPVDPRVIDEGPPGELLDRTAVYSFVAWDIGRHTPAFGPVVIAVAGRERSFAVGSQATVVVRSLLPADTTEQVPRDARAPLPLPGRLWQYLVLGTVFVALLTWLWLRHRARRRDAGEVTEAEAWAQAKASFAALETLGLADSGEPGRHVIASVDVMRVYIARRFPELKASFDATTFLTEMANEDFPVPTRRVATLVERDAALRFARASVTPDEAVALSAEARDIVAQLQLSHEARLRALERPPRPRRR